MMHSTLLQARPQILRAIREVFWSWGFFEVDTPLLVSKPGQEPYLNPFETTVHDAIGNSYPAYFITSPEYAMKKLLSAAATGEAPQFEKIFQLGHVFRNGEDFGGTHNMEFTMLEWYRLGENYEAIINDVENLICFLAEHFFALQLTYNNRVIDLTRPWPRMTVAEAFEKFAGRTDALELANNTNEFYKVFLNEVEPKLRELPHPVHLIDYPSQFAALAKKKNNDSRVAERVETYIGGLELTNGFSELTDANEQRLRFLEEQKERIALGKKPFPMDEKLLNALPQIQKAAGISLGVDRLIMLLLDANNINDVIFCPAKELFQE